jgi:hypothetical protein
VSAAPWTPAAAAACGLAELVRELRPRSGFGRASAAAGRAYGPGEEDAARAASARCAAAAAALTPEGIDDLRAAIAAAPDPQIAASRAAAGEILGDADFHDVARFAEALAAIAVPARVAGCEARAADPALVAALAPGRTAGGGGFYLDDAFDADLARARGEAAAAQAAYDAARGRLAERVAAATGRTEIRDGEFVLMRDAGPPPDGVRVVREAPGYFLCELALDAEALATLAARDDAAAAVARAEERVRRRLSASVAAAAPALAAACRALGELDVLAGRAAFAARHAGVVPDLVAGAGIVLDAARHPPLEARLAARGRAYEPISLALDGMAVVTGPNMGGKSAALRTLGFAAACAALGVPVPARAARLPLFAEIAWLGMGGAVPRADAEGDGDADGLLSAFGAELVAARAFLERFPGPPAGGAALVLIDEFAQTTAPREGRALLVALLEALRERGAIGLAATHYAGVAVGAGLPHFATGRLREPVSVAERPAPSPSLADALERVARGMDYGLVPTPTGSEARTDGGSAALELAAVLGLDGRLVARAAALLAAEPV